MKVIATKMGWYDNDRKRPGAIFEMEDKDYSYKDQAGRDRKCDWARPFTEYQRILSERIAEGMNIEEARDVETMSFDGKAVEKSSDEGPVASSAAARKAAAKKADKQKTA